PTLDIDPSLTLHREWTDKIDPITYEVIRHNLWNINEELGMTIQRISGSPVAMYAFDLNSSIFTEDGEFIYYGPYQLYMSAVPDAVPRCHGPPRPDRRQQHRQEPDPDADPPLRR